MRGEGVHAQNFGPELIDEVTIALQEARDFGVIESPCFSEAARRGMVDHCRHEILVPLALRFFGERDRLGLTGNDEVRKTLHRHRMTIRGRLFGSSVRPEVSNRRMEVDLATGNDLELLFSDFPFTRLSNVARRNYPEGGSCHYEILESVSDQVETTMRKMHSLPPHTREAWLRFCREYPEYEKKAQDMKNRGWRDDENRVYRGCAPGTLWTRIASHGLCGEGGQGGYPLYSPSVFEVFPESGLPDAFHFVFDGFGDFNAPMAMAMGAVNLRGDERGERIRGTTNANGLNFYARLSRLLDEQSEAGYSNPQLNYYDGSGMNGAIDENQALACYLDMQQWLGDLRSILPNLPRPPTIAVGFSNGGAAALEFQRSAGRANRGVDLVVTVDPIPRAAGYITRSITGASMLSGRHENTGRVINFYQDSDFGTMPPLELRSTPVQGADMNFHVIPEAWGGTDGRNAHVNILHRVPRVREIAACEMQAVTQGRPAFCF